MLIWDQAGWHKSNSLKVPVNIVLKSLPPYSPELNPVEKLWQWLKKPVCRNRLFAHMDDLMNNLTETLINLTPSRFMELCQCSYLLQEKPKMVSGGHFGREIG
jgi:transposase